MVLIEEKRFEETIMISPARESEERKYHCLGSAFDVWCLGITIVIGGGYFSWNYGLQSGFGSFSLATILTGSAYFCLILGTSEMLSTLPFAGGAYGIARCTLGFFPGYLVGCMDAIEYIIYTSLAAEALVSMIANILGIGNNYNPLLMLTFYVVSSTLHISGGKFFWQFIRIVGVLSFLITVIYCFGSLAYVDFSKNTSFNGNYFVGGMTGFLQNLPLASWFYVGIESLAFSCDLVHSPKTKVPKGMVCCMATLFVTSIFVLFVSSSLPPGIEQTSHESIILNTGFSLFLGCAEQYATVLSLPATFATGFGFVFAYGNLLYALASSKLIPEFFTWKGKSNTPFAAIICGSFVSYVICVLIDCFPGIQNHLLDICMLSAYVSYCSQCIGYIALKIGFKNLRRHFESPLGIFGSLYALAVFAISGVAVIGFLGDKQVAFLCFIVMIVLLSVYYFFHVKDRQTFSTDEEKILFVAHVMNYNKKAAQRRRIDTQRKKSNHLLSSSGSMKGSSSGQLRRAVPSDISTSRTHKERAMPLRPTEEAECKRIAGDDDGQETFSPALVTEFKKNSTKRLFSDNRSQSTEVLSGAENTSTSGSTLYNVSKIRLI